MIICPFFGQCLTGLYINSCYFSILFVCDLKSEITLPLFMLYYTLQYSSSRVREQITPVLENQIRVFRT